MEHHDANISAWSFAWRKPWRRISETRRRVPLAMGVFLSAMMGSAIAADHLDSASVVADPSLDIGDLFAWLSPTESRLNLAMTVVGPSFSEHAGYVFHVASGARFGETSSALEIRCRVHSEGDAECELGRMDSARGDARAESGLVSANGMFRMFVGPRNDPFFNNVRGTRAAYQVAKAAIEAGSPVDSAGCPALDIGTVSQILYEWRHTDGQPGSNFLAGWNASVIVVSVDLKALSDGGPTLAVWASTTEGGRQVDRIGRPLTGNALLGTIATPEEAGRLKEAYNAAAPDGWAQFEGEIARGLALYDGLDGECGNQILARPAVHRMRYRRLASMLADDRLWLNTASERCERFMAVELAAISGAEPAADCGGRSPTVDAVDVYRSLLVFGETIGIDDGVDRDDKVHSLTEFPFFAGPSASWRP